ncbi:MAG: hypothetical protein IPH68_07655 [Chitinophagaceae bacterium]|nr:hypothetical protein [Chitinophagaceae bacterium]MBK7557758.1 hypothetical protein [Chitinophagaceae bacterium]MBK9531434.1 hypothetical protein [Chitinophagaceae bacterium]
MKKIIFFACLASHVFYATAQNVGIGTTTPGFPLNFANTTGDKISLYGNTGNHYGFGIQGGLLQIHTDLAVSNIAFGHGSSSNFTERMRVLNTGYDGMSLNGRLILKNGSTDPVGGGAGVWLYKADNTGQLGFMGTQNNQNIGFYGGAAGWGFTYNALNSRVGIGNENPNAPLAFAPSLGKKITLYPGATGDVGFGVAGNRLQIYSDNPNADVAIGYDAAGTFNERFAVKPNGALAVNGNTGNYGELLISNGSGSSAGWVSAGAVIKTGFSGITNDLALTGTNSYPLNASAYTIVLPVPSRVILYYKIRTFKNCLLGPCNTKWSFTVYINSTADDDYYVDGVTFPSSYYTNHTFGPDYFDLPAGTHNFIFYARNRFNEPTISSFQAVSTIIPL